MRISKYSFVMTAVTVLVTGVVGAVPAVADPTATVKSNTAQAAPKPDKAQAIITSVTGSAASEVAPVRGQRRLTQKIPNGARHLAVLTSAAQSSATFDGLVPAGSTVTAYEGDFRVLTPSGKKMTILQPWAVDAAGKRLATSYTFKGSAITQKVDTTGALFPVVADPTWSLGWFIYGHLSRSEVFKAYGARSYSQMGWLACSLLAFGGPYVVTACALYTFWALTNLGQGIYTAAHSVWNGPSACVTAKFSYPTGVVPYYVGYSLNRCTTW